MKSIERDCINCQSKFNADVKEVKGKFCSLKCSGEYNGKNRAKPEPNVDCAWCAKKFYKNNSTQENSKSGLFFCTRLCKDTAQRLDGLKAIHPIHFGHGSNYREIAFRAKPKQCERCGYNTNPAGIVVHHIDRNRKK